MGTGEQHSTHFPSPLSGFRKKKDREDGSSSSSSSIFAFRKQSPFLFSSPFPTPSLRGSLENYILIIWERGRRPTTPAIRARLWLALTTCLLIISLALPTVLRKPSYGSAATAAISLTEGFFPVLCAQSGELLARYSLLLPSRNFLSGRQLVFSVIMKVVNYRRANSGGRGGRGFAKRPMCSAFSFRSLALYSDVLKKTKNGKPKCVWRFPHLRRCFLRAANRSLASTHFYLLSSQHPLLSPLSFTNKILAFPK